MKNTTFTAICLTLTLTACAGIYSTTDSTKRPLFPAEPYQCIGLESPFPEDWKCTRDGIELPEGEQNTMNINIQINKDLKL